MDALDGVVDAPDLGLLGGGLEPGGEVIRSSAGGSVSGRG